MEPKLLKKHELFLDEYLINGRNGTLAYLKVYPKVTRETAKANGHRLLTNADARQYLQERDAEMKEKYSMTKDKIVNILVDLIDEGKEIGDRKNTIAAINTLNKMIGFDAPIKSEVELKGIIINYKKPE
jgi:phage terminase small subunit